MGRRKKEKKREKERVKRKKGEKEGAGGAGEGETEQSVGDTGDREQSLHLSSISYTVVFLGKQIALINEGK